MKRTLAVGCILLLCFVGWVAQDTRALSPTPTPITPIPNLAPSTYVPQSVTMSTNLLRNFQFAEDNFGLIENWAQTAIDLQRWYLVQTVPPDQPDARWVDRVDLDGKGYALRSTDGQTCDHYCSTEAVQIVAAEENTFYVLSASARVEQGSAGIYLDFLDADRTRIQPYTRGDYTSRWTWQTVAAKAPPRTRYIRVILYTGNAEQATAYWRDVRLHSLSAELTPMPPEGTNVAAEKRVIARGGGITYPSWGNANDEADFNSTTFPDGGRWGNQTNQGTFETVDLGSLYNLVGVGYSIDWDGRFRNPLTFQVEVSPDNVHWTTVATITHQPVPEGGGTTFAIDVPIHVIVGRYVRYSEPADGEWNGWGDIFHLRAFARLADSGSSPTPTPLTGRTPTPIGSPAVISGLAAYYPFDGDASDASGNGNNGIVAGATLTEDRFGKPNHAYYFDGVNSHIIIPSSACLANMQTTMSIAAWIKIDASAAYAVDYDYRHIVSKGATYGNLWADYALGLHSDGELLWENVSGSNSLVRLPMQPPVSRGTWHHVAVTFDTGVVRAYLDGELQGRAQSPYETIRASTEPLYIGCRYEKPFVGAFQGSIDDVLITNRTLSDGEIQAIYQGQMAPRQTTVPTASPSPVHPTSGLAAYYPFDGDAEDKSGNGHHGTIQGAQWTAGRWGQALKFDGEHADVRTSGSYAFSSTNQITLVAWMKLTGHADFDGILDAYQCCTYRLLVSPQLHPYYNAGTHNDIEITSFDFQIGEWYQYAMTIKGGRASIFINGKKIYESAQGVPATLPDISDGFIIGSGEWSDPWEQPNHPLQGVVDEVRIYRRALTEAEILSLYQENTLGTACGGITLVSALDDHYDVDPGRYHLTVRLNGTTIFDAVPRLKHGQPYGKQFSNFAELVIPFDVRFINTGGNEIAITLDGAQMDYDWFCWDYVVLDDGYHQQWIESGAEWSYQGVCKVR